MQEEFRLTKSYVLYNSQNRSEEEKIKTQTHVVVADPHILFFIFY